MRNHSQHLCGVQPKLRLWCRYVHAILLQIYRSTRLHYWLWNERRLLVKLHSVGVAPVHVSLPHGKETELRIPAEKLPVIAEANEANKEIEFQRLLFADSGSFIKAPTGDPFSEAQELLKEVSKTFIERERQWIAGYDAHFLASMRIQFHQSGINRGIARTFERGPTRDSLAVNERRT